MKLRSATLWICAGALWLTAGAVVWWNSQRIDLISSIQDRNHAIRQESLFRRQHSALLARFQERYVRSFLLTDSFSLGMLTAQSAIRHAAEKVGIPPPRFSSPSDVVKEKASVIAVSAEGPPESVVHFLFELQRLNWLEERQLVWKMGDKDGIVSCELTVMIHFRSPDRSSFFSSEGSTDRIVF